MNTARAIIQARLRSIGADGLCSTEHECGCSIDDLQPCDGDCMDCVPARRTQATEDGDTYDKGDWIYSPMGATP